MKKYWLTDEEFEKELPELKERARRKEKWKAYPEDGSVEVSNCGRVRQNGQILPMTEKKGKDVCLEVSVAGKRQHNLIVYRLVAETWCVDPDKPAECNEVHHIDNNGYNNTPENLMWVTRAQHWKI